VGFITQKVLKLNFTAVARVALYVLSPCLAFLAIYRSTLTVGDAAGMLAVMLSSTAGIWFVGVATARVIKRDTAQRSGFLLTTLFTNAANYGVPLVELAFGSASRNLAVVCFVCQQVLFNTLGVYLAANGKLGWKQSIGKVLQMPVIYAIPLAVIFLMTGYKIPAPLDKSVTMLADAAIPMMLLLLGFQLASVTPDLREVMPIVLACSYRLVLSPALAVVALVFCIPLFAMSELAVKVVLVETAMPTAVTIVLLSIEFDSHAEFVSSVIFYSTIFSAVSLTFILTLLI
jgi:malate permease and related proteins